MTLATETLYRCPECQSKEQDLVQHFKSTSCFSKHSKVSCGTLHARIGSKQAWWTVSQEWAPKTHLELVTEISTAFSIKGIPWEGLRGCREKFRDTALWRGHLEKQHVKQSLRDPGVKEGERGLSLAEEYAMSFLGQRFVCSYCKDSFDSDFVIRDYVEHLKHQHEDELLKD